MKNVQSLIEAEKMQTETTAMFPPIKLEKKLVFIFRAMKGTEKYSCRNDKLTFLREIWHKIVNINTFQRLSSEGSRNAFTWLCVCLLKRFSFDSTKSNLPSPPPPLHLTSGGTRVPLGYLGSDQEAAELGCI